MIYFVKKPKWVRRFYGDCTWEVNTTEPVLYLTFDDGPHPTETPFVLDVLQQYNAKATFFCLGSEVEKHSGLFDVVKAAGHSVGNHTHSHLDGWRSTNRNYFEDIKKAQAYIGSDLFRPPFGHITWRQVKRLKSEVPGVRTILWNVLSADFDPATTPEQCFRNIRDNAAAGSIILMHDSEVATKNLRYTLPKTLDHFSSAGYRFEAL